MEVASSEAGEPDAIVALNAETDAQSSANLEKEDDSEHLKMEVNVYKQVS